MKRLCALLLALLMCAPAALAETLKEGDHGRAVHNLKQSLRKLGYYGSGKMSDQFNSQMTQKVLLFQHLNGLPETGEVDGATKAMLDSGKARKAWQPPLQTENNRETLYCAPLPEDLPEGFLTAGAEPYIVQDREQGLWIYVSEDIRIVVRRYTDTRIPLIWLESDIRMQNGVRPRALMDPAVKRPAVRDPREIAREYGAVLAISDDFYTRRSSSKDRYAGIILREGKILNDRTKRSGLTSLPNLDVLALFEDGSMRVYDSAEHSAQEYLDMGVTDTWAFGPLLIRNGSIQDKVTARGSNYSYLEPRNALGMIEPNHYLVLSVYGRRTDSAGVRLSFVAERMLDLGCTEALNLDGGNSVAVIFLGDMINKAQTDEMHYVNGIRSLSALIGFGSAAAE